MKKFFSLFIMGILIVFVSCSNAKTDDKKNISDSVTSDKSITLNIMTTDKLLYTIVKDIVKDKHNVGYMFKNRHDEIDFKPTYDSFNNISKKDLFIYVGASFEPWIDSFNNNLNKSKVGIINSSRGVKLLSYNNPVKYGLVKITQNPYYFMDVDNYKVMLVNIKNAVEDKDPQERSFYEKNFSEKLKDIQSYEKDMKSLDKELSQYNFICLNEDLSYFTNYNNMNLSYTGSSYGSILPIDPVERESVTKKLQQYKNKLILLYTNDKQMKDNAEVIKKFNIKTVKIKLFDGTESYENTLKYNINSLKSINNE